MNHSVQRYNRDDVAKQIYERWSLIAGYPRFRNYRPRDEGPPVNERVLKIKEVRVISDDGAQLGVMNSRDALNLAREKGLDLVVVATQADPPVCRIVNHGRYKYEQGKKEKENKKKTQDVKGIKMRPNIAENDLQTLLRHAKKFLIDGDKVRVTCQFRKMELAHPEIGQKKMLSFAEQLSEVSVVDKQPKLDGRQMIMVLNPKPQKPAAKKDEDPKPANEELAKLEALKTEDSEKAAEA